MRENLFCTLAQCHGIHRQICVHKFSAQDTRPGKRKYATLTVTTWFWSVSTVFCNTSLYWSSNSTAGFAFGGGGGGGVVALERRRRRRRGKGPACRCRHFWCIDIIHRCTPAGIFSAGTNGAAFRAVCRAERVRAVLCLQVHSVLVWCTGWRFSWTGLAWLKQFRSLSSSTKTSREGCDSQWWSDDSDMQRSLVIYTKTKGETMNSAQGD